MCKQKSRSIYLRNSDKIDRCELVYSRFPEPMIRGLSIKGLRENAAMWILDELGGNVHMPTFKKIEKQFSDAEFLGNISRHAGRIKSNGWQYPRFITVIMLYDKSNRAIGGGSSVCTAIDIPDRKLGYRLAFERMKSQLGQDGYTIVPRVEAEKLLGV